ncbi:hypothetical protein ACIBQX_38755 [Nonomuraea sp. NPDC049714]|uniref:hypothetical protein n=1 Tax=Nonomuraea sp. NPDC049714 TaxID=3364357 RepID=UPI0037B94CBA
MPRLPHARETAARVLTHVCEQVDWLDRRSTVAETVRAAAAVLEASEFLRTEDRTQGLAVSALLDRLLDAPSTALGPERLELLAGLRSHVRTLLRQPDWPKAPWADVVVSSAGQDVPTMLTEPTMRFYKWLGGTLSERARIAEFGPWLGSSTRCLCEGMGEPAGQSVDAYDSFVWSGWMDTYVPTRPYGDWPRPGDSFLSLFQETVRPYHPRVVAHPCWIDDSLDSGERPAWDHLELVELLVYDMGPDRALLDIIWEVFSPHFEPERTLLVFNEYGKVHASALWDFCDDHADRLRPRYKPDGTAKAFLYV